jgi:hypothetical protein
MYFNQFFKANMIRNKDHKNTWKIGHKLLVPKQNAIIMFFTEKVIIFASTIYTYP